MTFRRSVDDKKKYNSLSLSGKKSGFTFLLPEPVVPRMPSDPKDCPKIESVWEKNLERTPKTTRKALLLTELLNLGVKPNPTSYISIMLCPRLK